MLSVVAAEKKKLAALQKLDDALTRGASVYRRSLGWQGGRATVSVYWHPEAQMWAAPNQITPKDHHWYAFGRKNPEEWQSKNIVVEINVAKKGYDRRCAGALVAADDGEIFLAHSGKVGGGRKGIGKKNFLDYFGRQSLVNVRWPDGQQSDLLLISPLSDTNLVKQIGYFVGKVRDFKGSVRSVGRSSALAPSLTYRPEFLGAKKKYSLAMVIRQATLHGPVVDALSSELQKLGMTVANDKGRDLLALVGGNTHTLFEVKTDISTSSLYAATGQLMLHGAQEATAPRRVIVLPEMPDRRTASAFNKIGIEVLVFKRRQGNIEFDGLAKFLNRWDG